MFVFIFCSDLDKVTDVKKEHLPLLHKMKAKADDLIAESRKSGKIDKDIGVEIGFHSIPSMKHLHMHVISMDFDSPCLKRSVHWNSFTTEFFVPYDRVLEQLETKGVVEVDKEKMEALQKQKMVCFVCHQPIKNIPELKRHIASGCLKCAKVQKRKQEPDNEEGNVQKRQCVEKEKE